MHAGDIQYLPCTVGELHMGGSVSLPASPTTLSSILSYSLGTGVHDTTARYLRRHIVVVSTFCVAICTHTRPHLYRPFGTDVSRSANSLAQCRLQRRACDWTTFTSNARSCRAMGEIECWKKSNASWGRKATAPSRRHRVPPAQVTSTTASIPSRHLPRYRGTWVSTLPAHHIYSR